MHNIKILIAEDEKPKRDHVSNFLDSNFYVKTLYSASVNSTIISIEDDVPNFIILDMSLPTNDLNERDSGGRPQGFGGRAVLRHMKLARIEIPVVILTGYEVFKSDVAHKATPEHVDLEQLRVELNRDFNKFFIDIIHFNSTNKNWQKSLFSCLKNNLPRIK